MVTLHLVGVDRCLHVSAPELAATVVVVGQGRGPGVLVQVHHTLGVHVAGTFLEGGLQHPDAVFFIAHVLRIDMAGGGQNLIGAYARIIDLVVVIRNVDFLFADDGPVVAVRGTVEQTVFVVHAETAGAGRRVVAHGRRATHPALTGAVLPGLTRGGGRVDELVTDDDLAFLAHRFQRGDQEVGENAVGCLQGSVRVGPDREDLVVDLFEYPLLVGVHHGLPVVGLFGGGAAGEGVVEHQLAAVLGNRER
ncbi:hypothetical protein D3C78_1052690 [compost metagenome]